MAIRCRLLDLELVMFDKFKEEREIQGYLRAISDADRTKAAVAIRALGTRREPQALEPIMQALKDENKDVRNAAIWALGEYSVKQAVEPLVRKLKDTDSDVRANAAKILGEYRNTNDVPLEGLILSLQDANPFARAVAARTLGKWGKHAAVEPLINCLADPEPEVRKVVAKALKRLGEPSWNNLIFGTPNDFIQLGASRDSRMEPLLLKLMHGSNWRMQIAAAQGLARMNNPKVLPVLLKALGHKSPEVRTAAAQAMGTLGSKYAPFAMDPLLLAMEDENEGVRQAVVSALDKLDAAK